MDQCFLCYAPKQKKLHCWRHVLWVQGYWVQIKQASKQKVRMTSSTYTEMMGTSNYLPNTIRAMQFMTEQGYPTRESLLGQDDESAIKVETNRQTLAGAKSWHLDIRYFWMKDSAKTRHIKMCHCWTLKILADFSTKGLQGALYQEFCNVVVSFVTSFLLILTPSLPVDEHVEERQQDRQGTERKQIIELKKACIGKDVAVETTNYLLALLLCQ